jgi:E3 Ubiquitin ligase
LPLDVDIYVLGVVGENGCISEALAGAKGQRFLLSVKSEETRAAELGNASKMMLWLGIFCLAGAILNFGAALWLAREGLYRVSRGTCRTNRLGDKALNSLPR